MDPCTVASLFRGAGGPLIVRNILFAGRHSIGGRRLPSVSMTVSDQGTTTHDLLDPSTGIVAPPSYDSLEKSPPKYEELSHCNRQHMLPSYTTQPSSVRQPMTSVTCRDDALITGETGSTGDDRCASRSCSAADGAVTSGLFPVPMQTRLASLPGSPGLLLSANQLPSYDEVTERSPSLSDQLGLQPIPHPVNQLKPEPDMQICSTSLERTNSTRPSHASAM